MASIHIGTSGFSYQHWRGVFYPEGLSQQKWLEFYAQHFSTVELNVTFYRLPSEKAVESWRRRAPEGFLYAAKLSRLITHSHRLHNAEEALATFLERMRILGEHLGPILIQLPPGMPQDVDRLDAFLGQCNPTLRWAVEVRNAGWLNDTTYVVLRRHGAALCIHDLITPHPIEITAPFTYLRFHGAGQLYGGDYPDTALRPWADRLLAWQTQGIDGYAYFNNDACGYAVKNAKMLQAMVRY